MEYIVIILSALNFSITASLYVVHNWYGKFLKNACGLTNDELSVLEMFSLLRFFSSFIWTYITDRTKWHRFLCSFCILAYSLSLFLFIYSPNCFKPNGMNFFTIFYHCLSLITLAGVYPILDTINFYCLEDKKDCAKKFGMIKVWSSIGHMASHVSVLSCNRIFKIDKGNDVCMLPLTLIYAIIAALIIFLGVPPIKNNEIPTTSRKLTFKQKFIRNCIFIKELLGCEFILLCMVFLTQGIYRSGVTGFLMTYFDESNIDKDAVRTNFIIKTFPEMAMWYITPFMSKMVGVRWMLFLSIGLGTARALSYGFINIPNMSIWAYSFVILTLESTKGVFSGLFGFAQSTLAQELSTPDTRSVSQGIVNGVYNGIAPFIAGLLGAVFLKKESFKYKDNPLRAFFIFLGVLGLFGFIFLIWAIFVHKKENKKKKQILSFETSL